MPLTLPAFFLVMSTSPSPKSRSSLSKANIGAAPILGDPLLLQNPKLIHIANQLANWKCWKALQDGQIQVVHRRKSPMYIPRLATFYYYYFNFVLTYLSVPMSLTTLNHRPLTLYSRFLG